MADPHRLPELGLGLVVWEGEYLDVTFVDREGRLIPTGSERAAQERSGPSGWRPGCGSSGTNRTPELLGPATLTCA